MRNLNELIEEHGCTFTEATRGLLTLIDVARSERAALETNAVDPAAAEANRRVYEYMNTHEGVTFSDAMLAIEMEDLSNGQ